MARGGKGFAAEQHQTRRRGRGERHRHARREDGQREQLERYAVEHRFAFDQQDRALIGLGVDRDTRAGFELYIGIDRRGMLGGGRGGAPHTARQHARRNPTSLDQRQAGLGDMLERRVDLLLVVGQREPSLHPVERRCGDARRLRGALRMDDSASGGHQVDRAGFDHLVRAKAVAVGDRAFEQIGHGGEVDVRVGADIHRRADFEPRRAELVDEDERPDHRAGLRRKGTADGEGAEVVGDGGDDEGRVHASAYHVSVVERPSIRLEGVEG